MVHSVDCLFGKVSQLVGQGVLDLVRLGLVWIKKRFESKVCRTATGLARSVAVETQVRLAWLVLLDEVNKLGNFRRVKYSFNQLINVAFSGQVDTLPRVESALFALSRGHGGQALPPHLSSKRGQNHDKWRAYVNTDVPPNDGF